MLPLEDVKVVDFMWALAGPGTTRRLADYGATVVRIESASKIDGARTVGPFHNNIAAHDGSGLSYTNSVSTNGIVRLLSAAKRERWGPALRSTLPAAGEGTLDGRLVSVRVRAKTGTLLQQVSALSGWVWLEQPRRWAEFSILSRGLSKHQAVVVEDAIVSIISKQL